MEVLCWKLKFEEKAVSFLTQCPYNLTRESNDQTNKRCVFNQWPRLAVSRSNTRKRVSMRVEYEPRASSTSAVPRNKAAIIRTDYSTVNRLPPVLPPPTLSISTARVSCFVSRVSYLVSIVNAYRRIAITCVHQFIRDHRLALRCKRINLEAVSLLDRTLENHLAPFFFTRLSLAPF